MGEEALVGRKRCAHDHHDVERAIRESLPVTLYVEQWERLLEFAPHLKEFMAKQNGLLSRKNRS